MKIAVIGLGKFGSSLVKQLSAMDHEVMAIDILVERVDAIKDHATHAVVADASASEVVEELSLATMDINVVAIGKGFESSMMVTTRLRQIEGPKLFVRSITDLHSQLLEMTGVDEVIKVESLAATNFAHRIDHLDYVRHIVIDEKHAVAEVEVPGEWVGKALSEVGLRLKHRLNLITVLSPVEDDKQALESIPSPDLVFKAGDYLVLYGHEDDLNEFIALHGKSK